MAEWESFIRFQTETEAFDYSITLDEIEVNNKFDCWENGFTEDIRKSNNQSLK
jgi:L-rhamnose mutarotase